MNIRRRIILSSILVLTVTVALIAAVTMIFIVIFALYYPLQSIGMNIGDLFDISGLMQALVTAMETSSTALRSFYLWLVICAVIIIGVILANTIILSKSIYTPIRELTRSVDRMKNGDFETSVAHTQDLDLNNLCTAFDDMRQKIKESREVEKRHLENRKMLLANLSHDLKTPLTSIKGYIEGINDGVADTPEKLKKYLTTIYTKTLVMEDMLENMSDFAKLEMGKLQFDFEIGDINDLLAQIEQEYSLDALKQGIEIKRRLCAERVCVKLDFQKMRRVITNIIDNAIKYRKPENSEIEITSEVFDGGILVKIEDNGIGINANEINHVFDGFYRCDPSRNQNIKGNGLGLGIAKQIVEQHSGKIWVKSDVGEGTQIFIYLPRRSVGNE